MESELWPNLIMSAAEKGVRIFLVNLKYDEISVHHHAHFWFLEFGHFCLIPVPQEQTFCLGYS